MSFLIFSWTFFGPNSELPKWSSDLQKPIKAAVLAKMLGAAVQFSSDPLTTVSEIQTTGISELMEGYNEPDSNDGVPTSEAFPTLTKSTFLAYFRVCLSTLVTILNDCHVHKGVNILTEQAATRDMQLMVAAQFDRISNAFATLTGLLDCVKEGALQTQAALVVTFKVSEKIVTAFLKRGMPLMDKFFINNFEKIHVVLKAVQKPTRVLQRLCSHAKDDKRDDRVTALVPALKRSLETLVFRVKSLLASHNCEDAMTIGLLKNKDMRGQNLSSQVPVNPDDEDDDEDDESDDATQSGEEDSDDD